MVFYEVRWKHSAEKDLRDINPRYIPRVLKSVESLSKNPYPRGHRKLRGSEHIYRIRIGDYRAIYQVQTQSRAVIIYHIRHRGKAYQ